jgi:hypothetical protein
MNNPRQQLKQLIEELKIPMLAEEVDEKLKGLTDEEVESLVYRYQQVKDYEDQVDKLASEKNPEEYQKIMDEYDDKVAQLEEDHLNDLQKVHEQSDKQLDEAEEKYAYEIAQTVKEAEDTATAAIDVINTMTEEAKNISSKNKKETNPTS